jgi:hypothetical protein
MTSLIDIERTINQPSKTKIKKCIPMFILIGSILLGTTVWYSVGFSLYTVHQGQVGYIDGVDGYTSPGVYLQLPWLPKSIQISVLPTVVKFSDFKSVINDSSNIIIKNLHVKYSIIDIDEYVNQTKTNGYEEYKFYLKVHIDNDIGDMFAKLSSDEAINVTEDDFKANIFSNSTIVEVTNVIFSKPMLEG